MGQDDRVVVDIDDPAVGCHLLRDLVGIARGRMPVPMSRNWRMPASPTRKCTARPRNARLARARSTIVG